MAVGRFDTNTENFEAAAEAFEAASADVRALRRGAVHLRTVLERSDTLVHDREQQVAASPAVQSPPEDGGAHNAETRASRSVRILANDADYLAHRQEAEQARKDLAENEIELERRRDQRSLAGRRMDFVIATVAPDDEFATEGDDGA